MDSLLSLLLGPPIPRGATRSIAELVLVHGSTVDRAAAAGFVSDRLGHAFVGGYRAALARLVPGISPRACFAATERGGAHPRAIETTLRAAGPDAEPALRLDGTKTWVTLGTEADELLVVARLESLEGPGSLRVVRLPSARAGITLVAGPPTPFAPEVPHAEARFDGVRVAPEELLSGDGYDVFLKPFRTIEDLHVLAALHGYWLGVARSFSWPRVFVEETLASLLGLRALGELDPRAPETHVALGGAFAHVARLMADTEPYWSLCPSEERERWARDRPLLEIAGRARSARLDVAWTRVGRS